MRRLALTATCLAVLLWPAQSHTAERGWRGLPARTTRAGVTTRRTPVLDLTPRPKAATRVAAPTPTITLKPKPQVEVEGSARGSRVVTATGYCSCVRCCGKSNGITASGAKAAWGTIAAPRSYAMGERYTIGGLSGVFAVRDRGGAIKGDRIDIWFPTHSQALAWGRRTVTLTPVR